MKIDSLYRDYFQKSRVFLYPLLNLKRGGSVTPIQTYVAWEGLYKPEDRMLICVYHIRDDKDFEKFEKTKLLANKYFHDFKAIKENRGVYIFDFNSKHEDWDKVLKGKYSQLSTTLKRKIKIFQGADNNNYAYIESYLHPEKYYKMYAELLSTSVQELEQVGELCSIIDMDKETLTEKPIKLIINKNEENGEIV